MPLHMLHATSLCMDYATLRLASVCAGSFNAVDLADLEIASHFVKYAVASYAIVPVTEDPDKK